MKILFWSVKNRTNKHGECPIYCRITIDGRRSEISTGINIKPGEFDTKKQCVKGNSPSSTQHNNTLNRLRTKINNTFYREIYNGNHPSADDVKRFITVKHKRITLLCELITHFALELFKIHKDEAKLQQHERYVNVINVALRELNAAKVALDRCNIHFLDGLAHHLVIVQEYSPGYTKKVFGFIKRALKYAFNQRYIDRLYADDYKLPFKVKSNIVYLDEVEVNKLYKYSFSDCLQKYADLFLVQCYTGLSFVDLKRLKREFVKPDTNGIFWIDMTRQKVETSEFCVPVVDKVLTILNKYDFCLPSISIQKYNAALKRIASELNINKNLTTHVGRKTYGMLLLNKDVPIETVSRLLGHSSIQTTQKHYAKVLHVKVARDVLMIL